MQAEDIVYAIGWVVVFILSTTLHEAAHAWAAKRGGDLTAYAGGQVSLDPLPHIKREPFGMLILPIISAVALGWPFGYASAPYNPAWAHKYPKKAARMAAAGPLANLLIVFICALLIRLGMLAGVFSVPDYVSFRHVVQADAGGIWFGLSVFLSMMFILNLILFILNLLPLPPLDGSGAVALFMKEDTARAYRGVISNPVLGIVGILVAWQVLTPLFDMAFPAVMFMLYGASYG
jgi:Zn-dependent protease